jgi:hypothetical protein
LLRILELTISEFAEQYPEQVKSCLLPRGYLAWSVPNREW